jgi:hypothetical protein
MSEQLALGLTALVMVAGYIAAIFLLARFIANWLDRIFAPRHKPAKIDEDTGIAVEHDDQVVSYDTYRDPMGNQKIRLVSRGDMRVRTWYFLLVMPLFLYLHYKFWDQLMAGFEIGFEWLGNLIVELFYDN